MFGHELATHQTVVVGEQIIVQAATDPPGGVLTNIQWSVQDDTVTNYIMTQASGAWTDLTAIDMEGSELTFYWIDGGNKVVQVTADVGGSGTQTASVTYTVVRPTMTSFQLTFGTTNICDPATTGAHPALPTDVTLAAYDPVTGTRGCVTTASVSVPPPWDDGWIGLVQLCNYDIVSTLNNGRAALRNSNGAFVLDSFRGGVFVPLTPVPATSPIRVTDSPAIVLRDVYSARSADEQFQTYLMFQPNTPNSIWVTIGVAQWKWQAQATRNGAPAGPGNSWTLSPGSVLDGTDGIDSTTLPTWNGWTR